MLSNRDQEIINNQDFQRLVRVRRRVSWSFLLGLLGLYLAYGMMSVYTPGVLASPVLSGGVIPVGIAMGYAILALTFIITAVYVRISNQYFVPLERKIVEGIQSGIES